MKKLIFIIPLTLLFLHFMYNIDGMGVWTTDFAQFGRVMAIKVNPTTQTTVYSGTLDSGIIKTTNSGTSWFTSNSGMSYVNSQCLTICAANPNVLYSGTDSLGSSKGVYKTTDGGATWTNVTNDGFTSDRSIQAIVVDPTNANIVYVGIFNAQHDVNIGVWKSTNGGTNWTAANSGMSSLQNILSLAIDPTNSSILYAGTSFVFATQTGPTLIYKSTNAGASWVNSSSGLPSASTDINPIRAIDVSKGNSQYVAAGLFQNVTTGGFFLSTNGGSSWTKMHTGLPATAAANIRAVMFRPNYTSEIYCGIDNATGPSAVYRTTNTAASWSDFNGGTMQASYLVRAFSFRATGSDSTLYGGVGTTAASFTAGQGCYEYSWQLVGIKPQNGTVPTSFNLYQNFPNPFNPTTVIQYDIPKASFVTLTVYDMSGKVIGTLVNEQKQAGTYQVSYNASSLSSGVYFYKITAGSFVSTKKMILVK